MRVITSRDNAQLKRLRKLLASSAARREEHRTVLDGPHLLSAYLDRFGATGVEAVVARSRLGNAEIAALSERLDEDACALVEDDLFRGISPSEHPAGIVASVRIPSGGTDGAGSPSAATDSGGRSDTGDWRAARSQDILLLDGIQDPGNVGALLRTACAAGFAAAYLSPGCADAWSPKCLRGGMGAQFDLRVEEGVDLLAVLRDFGGSSLACDAHANASLYELALQAPLAVLMGAEGAGLRPELSAAASQRCRIPMLGGVESLNVGAAGAVVMYEWLRRRTDSAR